MERPLPPSAPPPQTVPAPAVPAVDSRHRVAVLVPLTGPDAGVGQSIANAANLALADAGSDRIRITVYDTATGAQAAADRALADGSRLFLGPLLAEDVRAVAPIAKRAAVPVVSFSNDVTVAGNGVYIMGFNPGQSIERVIGHGRSQGAQRFAALIPEGDYGRRASQAFLQSVARAGGRSVGMQTYARSPAALRAAATRLNAQSGYDAVLIADNGQIAMSAAPLIRNGRSGQARILGTELWRTDEAITRSAALRGARFASVPETMFDQLKARYRTRYGANPYRLASLGYDAVLLAVRIGNQWRLERPFPEVELGSREGFSGIDGAFRFRPDGVAERRLEVVQVNAGSLSAVSPAERDFRN